MNVKNNNRLDDLKNLSIEANEMTAVKGGNWGGVLPGGTSKPKKPTSQYSYMGIVYGG